MSASILYENHNFLSEITDHLLETYLVSHLKPTPKLKSFTVCKNTNGDGFLAEIYRINLVWEQTLKENTNGILPTRVILKIRSNRGMFESETLKNCGPEIFDLYFKSFKMVHFTECEFYQKFSNVVPIPVPKYYFSRLDNTDGTGYLIMEDLANGQDMSPVDGLSAPQLFNVVEHLAKLHCWSLNADENLSTSFMHYYDFPSWYSYLHKLTNETMEKLCQSYPAHFHKIDKSVIDKAFDKNLLVVPEGRGVLAHGDFWIHNILFDSTNKNEVLGFIDWQFANVGNFADDFARLLIYSVRTDIRRNNEIQLLEHYYQCLKLGLKDQSKLPNFDDLVHSYRLRFACEAIQIVCDFSLLIEECLQLELDTVSKQEYLNELLCRGSATLCDAENILKTLI